MEHGLSILNEKKKPISLYIHIPYCQSLCFYCGCTKDIHDTKRIARADPREDFLLSIEKEIASYAKNLKKCKLSQIHLGGGTPTFLSPKQLAKIFYLLDKYFTIDNDAAISVEIDPRITTLEHLRILSSLGCVRLSLGIQDFDERVQKAVNRMQSFSMVEEFVGQCRALNFSLSFDLIYGLPFQTLSTMKETLNKLVMLSPDRIAFYRLAMIPSMFKWQKVFDRKHLPNTDEILAINLLIIKTLTTDKYFFIGLDHFAKENDYLYKAFTQKSLRRNFQGMTTGGAIDIIGLGPSAISQYNSHYVQNSKTTKEWHQQVREESSILKGAVLNRDDQIRKAVIENLYCYGSIDKSVFSQIWNVNFDNYFSAEKKDLDVLNQDEIINIDHSSLHLTKTLGRLLVRVVASSFDGYLSHNKENISPTFSQLG
jgi:oxygen-independent coproporphyrinogen-3 oxidase